MLQFVATNRVSIRPRRRESATALRSCGALKRHGRDTKGIRVEIKVRIPPAGTPNQHRLEHKRSRWK